MLNRSFRPPLCIRSVLLNVLDPDAGELTSSYPTNHELGGLQQGFGIYSRSPKVGNPIASILKSNL